MVELVQEWLSSQYIEVTTKYWASQLCENQEQQID